MTEPRLTVAICTIGRPDELRTLMESLLQQEADSRDFEVVVVDNGPSAAVAALAKDLSNVEVTFRYVQERRRGLTYARRRAWKVARGQLVGYLDDDAVAHTDWVATAIEALTSKEPDAAMVGGPVHDVEVLSEPWPFTDSPGRNGLDLGSTFRRMTADENLWGGNFVVRRNVLVGLDGFGEPLGHRDGHPGANEDILIQRQIDRIGLLRVYDPKLQIVHASWRAGATEAQRVRLAYHSGIDDAMLLRLLGENSWRQRSSAAAARLRRLRSQVAAEYRLRRAGDDQAARQARIAAVQSLGTVKGWMWPPMRPEPKPQD